jgi:hypothetical protein
VENPVYIPLPQAKILLTHDIPLARSIRTWAVFFQNGTIGPTTEQPVTRFRWNFALEPAKSNR